MNKKLMAVAVAGALSAPGLAAAQVGSSPGITLYGTFEDAVLNMKFSSDFKTQSGQAGGQGELKKGELYSVASRLGFRGREDLGGGVSAWIQAETGVTLNGRNDALNAGSSLFGGRPSAIGLTNPWGDIFFGIWDSPYKRVTDQTYNLVNSGPFSSSGVLMGNGDTTGSMPNALCGSSAPAANTAANIVATLPTAGVCFPEVTGGSTSFHRRNNDSVNYTSPMMAGFQFAIQTELPNYQSPGGSSGGGGNGTFPAGVQHAKLWSLNGIWARGPLVLAAGYELHQGFRPGTAAGQNINPKDTAIQGGIKWDFGIAQIGAGVEKISYGDNTGGATVNTKMDITNWQLNGKLALGPGALWGQYTKSSAKSCTNPALAANGQQLAFTVIGNAACSSDAKEFAIGYDYILSKRTKVYLAYNKIDNGNGTNYYYAAPSAPAQTANGTFNSITAGTDVQVLAVGIQHSF